MLKDIIETRDIDLSNYYSLQVTSKYLTKDDFRKIRNELIDFQSIFYSSKNDEALCSIGRKVNINRKPSKLIHGIYHVEKVFLYCYLMVKVYNDTVTDEKDKISDELAKILYYAAFYHDVGRLDNSEDTHHGLNSAKIFHNYFKKINFFSEETEGKKRLYLAEVLMDIHCAKDDNDIDFFVEEILDEHNENYQNHNLVKNYGTKQFELLINFLKDADALDRERFGKWDRASLNEDYLRTSIAKDLVGFASELNSLYYNIIKSNFPDIDLSDIKEGECFHSIGVDFFKISSILKNGILSQDELKKRGIIIPRNFPGGNFDRWISVVDEKEYRKFTLRDEKDKRRYASEVFTHQGITFFCQNVKFILPCDDRDRECAFETGLPWNRSGYVDERYALNKINPENILGLFIPFEILNKDIRDLEYINPSSNMDIIRARIDYYLKYTGTSNDSNEYHCLSALEDEYEKLIIEELRKPFGEGNSNEYFENTEKITKKINIIIGNLIYNHYAARRTEVFPKLDKVYKIVQYELQQTEGIEFNVEDYEFKQDEITECNVENALSASNKELFFSISRNSEKKSGKIKLLK